MLMIWQVNGGAMHLIMQMGLTGNLNSIDCILNGEWHREHRVQEKFLEGMVISQRVGPEI